MRTVQPEKLHTPFRKGRFCALPPRRFNIYMSPWLRCFSRKTSAPPSGRFSRRFCKTLTINTLRTLHRFFCPKEAPFCRKNTVFSIKTATFDGQKCHFEHQQSATLDATKCHFGSLEVALSFFKTIVLPCRDCKSGLKVSQNAKMGLSRYANRFNTSGALHTCG